MFTAIVHDAAELEEMRQLPGVDEVRRVQNRVFKLRVEPEQLDSAMAQVRSKRQGGICHHAYIPKAAENTRYYITEYVVVKFHPNQSKSTIERVLAHVGARLVKEYRDAENTYLLQVTDAAGKNPIKVANTLAEMREVAYAEPNLIDRFQVFHQPSDTYYPRQWHLDSWTGPELDAEADVSAPTAWDVTRGSRSIVVAVIDDGFDLSHPDFTGSGKVVFPKDYVDGDANPFPESSHGDYHGTPCAGVAIAEENNRGVVGIAPGCAFMPVRFPLTADDDLMWEIFDYVGRRADVISCSWGPPPVYAPLGQLMKDKLDNLAATGGPRKKGCSIFFAAGNYNAPLKDTVNPNGVTWRHPTYGTVTTRGPIVNGYATHPGVVAVAASTSLNRKAAYSNWGEEISVCAPSSNFHPLNPNEYVPGRSIWTTDNEQFGADFTMWSRYTGRFGGTSSATPLAAGVAAMVLSVNPELDHGAVRQILEETADKIVDEQPDPVLGRRGGTYDNGHSEWFGYGKINAARAVTRANELLVEEMGIEELAIVAGAENHLNETGANKVYRVRTGASMVVSLDGPVGEDFDLYIRRGVIPTTEDYDARGYTSSSSETITLHVPASDDYYIMVRSYRGAGDYRLKVAME